MGAPLLPVCSGATKQNFKIKLHRRTGEKNMPIDLVLEQPTYQNIPPGSYDGQLIDINDVGLMGGNEQYAPKPTIELRFAIPNRINPETGQHWEITVLANKLKKLNRKSKVYQIALAMFDPEPVPRTLTLGGLIGKKCQIVVAKVIGKDGTPWSRVVNFLPLSIAPAAGPTTVSTTLTPHSNSNPQPSTLNP
jgi:hypothetical protein